MFAKYFLLINFYVFVLLNILYKVWSGYRRWYSVARSVSERFVLVNYFQLWQIANKLGLYESWTDVPDIFFMWLNSQAAELCALTCTYLCWRTLIIAVIYLCLCWLFFFLMHMLDSSFQPNGQNYLNKIILVTLNYVLLPH